MTEHKHRREAIVTALRAHRAALVADGCLHLALFGSVARGDDRPDSDLDFAAVYDYGKVRSLMDMGGIAARIIDIVGTDNVDLADETRLVPPVRKTFDQSHVRIF